MRGRLSSTVCTGTESQAARSELMSCGGRSARKFSSLTSEPYLLGEGRRRGGGGGVEVRGWRRSIGHGVDIK
jgi:hypothetical protein